MKVKTKKEIVVTEYVTDFGTVCKEKCQAIKTEAKEYEVLYKKCLQSEFNPLIKKCIEELDKHISNPYCDLSIQDESLYEMLIRIERKSKEI